MLLELGLHLRAPSLCVTRNPCEFNVCTFICKVLLVLKGGESLGGLLRPIGYVYMKFVVRRGGSWCCGENRFYGSVFVLRCQGRDKVMWPEDAGIFQRFT